MLACARAVIRRMKETAAAVLCRRVTLTMAAIAGMPRPRSDTCMLCVLCALVM